MHALCPLLLLALAAPPLASEPEQCSDAASAPASWSDLPVLSARRLRFGLGASYSHLTLSAPGGNSLGGGGSIAWESRFFEVALALYGQGGFEAQDERARHSVSVGHDGDLVPRMVLRDRRDEPIP